MKNTTNVTKISLEAFKGRFESQEKDSANLKIGQLKLSSVKNRKKKIREPKEPVGHHLVDQLTHCGSPRKKGEKGREGEII